MTSLWLATKRLLKQQDVIPPLNGPAKFETNAEKSEVFANHFASCFTPVDEDAVHYDQRENSDKSLNVTNNDKDHNNIIIPTSPKEIQLLISKLKNKKNPGHDLITNKILKNLTSKALSYLAALFNAAMRMMPSWHRYLPLYMETRYNSNYSQTRKASKLSHQLQANQSTTNNILSYSLDNVGENETLSSRYP